MTNTALQRFTWAYAALSLPRLLRAGRMTRKDLFINSHAALFPAVLPIIYRVLRAHLRSISPILHLSASQIAALVSSPLLLLIPPGLRLYIAVYTLTSAIVSFVRYPPNNGPYSRQGTWRKYLPPIWTLNVLGNCVMLPMWLLGPEGSLPKSYENVIIAASRAYYTPGPTLQAPTGIKYALAHLEQIPTLDKRYSRATTCMMLHPASPSCLNYFTRTTALESLRVVQWVAGFELISVLLKSKGLKESPTSILRRYIINILRGTLFISGSISTSWAATCLFQFLLPDNTILPRARFFLNGLLGSLWILILPARRQAEISTYVFRVMLVNLWNMWKVRGSGTRNVIRQSTRGAEVAVFGVGWAALLGLARKGYRVDGLSARALRMLEHS